MPLSRLAPLLAVLALVVAIGYLAARSQGTGALGAASHYAIPSTPTVSPTSSTQPPTPDNDDFVQMVVIVGTPTPTATGSPVIVTLGDFQKKWDTVFGPSRSVGTSSPLGGILRSGWYPCQDRTTAQVVTAFWRQHAFAVTGDYCDDRHPLTLAHVLQQAQSFLPSDAKPFKVSGSPYYHYLSIKLRSFEGPSSLPLFLRSAFPICRPTTPFAGQVTLNPNYVADSGWVLLLGSC